MVLYTCSRTFSKKEFLDSFIEGNIRFNELEVYHDLEGDPRQDKNEGSTALFQSEKTELKIGGIEVLPSDIVGPIILKGNTLSKHILCLSAFYFPKTDKIFETKEEFIKNINRPKIEVINGFGSHTVLITDLKEFFKRVDKALMDKNKSFKRGLVEYIDFNSFHGKISSPGFSKDKSYKDESEYRISISNLPEGPFNLNIGNIEDITKIVENDQLNLIDVKHRD